MRVLAVIIGFTAALSVAGGAPATTAVPGEATALKALRVAPIDAATRADGRAEVARAAHLARTLPSGRREHVVVAIQQLASFYKRLTQPRALSLVGQLRANDDYFAKHYAPSPKTDITDEDGVVYRYFPGRCLEFHPLGNFGALNERVAENDADGAQRLADALVARGVYQHGGGIAWEYPFDYGGGRAPWLSGMAQAVAAQAFARVAALVPDHATEYLREAHAAYAAIPGRLLTSVAAGPWIRLYSFQSLPVLNAQLQAVVSLQSYATVGEDAQAGALAARMQRAAAATLPAFDTGYWTYYSLAHDSSPVDYQQYVVQLLRKLAPADPRFADAATRFNAYLTQPPAFRVANGPLGAVRFWLSKPSSVLVDSAAGPAKRLSLDGGWHTLVWGEPKRPGVYPVHVAATDWAGNHAAFDALPIVRAATATRSTAALRSSGFAVGAALDDVSQASSLTRLGLRLARVGVAWPIGSTAPDPNVVAALQSVPSSLGIVLQLLVSPVPADDAGRAALSQYATALAQQVPNLRDLILAPAPTAASGTDYGYAFAQLRDAVHAVVPTLPVGIAVDGSQSPKSTLPTLGPVIPDVVDFRPAPAPAKSMWTAADVGTLKSAIAAASGAQPPVLIDGATAAELTTFACGGAVAGVLFDSVADITPAVAATAAAAQRGSTVCPGVATQVAATGLAYPETLGAPVSVQFGCDADCLYLVTLEDTAGRPVVAKRGELRGGMPPATVTLPPSKLGAGPYRIGVRLVAQVNPGAITTLLSDAY